MPNDHTGPLGQAKRHLDETTRAVSGATRQLEEARAARVQAREALDVIMQVAQREGMTWKQIGDAIGLTPQGASQMYKRWERGQL